MDNLISMAQTRGQLSGVRSSNRLEEVSSGEVGDLLANDRPLLS